jgi:hypothetical protein
MKHRIRENRLKEKEGIWMYPVNTDKRKWLIFRCRLLHQLANRPQSKENYYEKLRGLSYNGKKVRPPRRHCIPNTHAPNDWVQKYIKQNGQILSCSWRRQHLPLNNWEKSWTEIWPAVEFHNTISQKNILGHFAQWRQNKQSSTLEHKAKQACTKK